tara:strand:+ start:2910 stop:3149 length:240 start_codon:yes stop_codon:yes gene_type:complete
MNRNDFILIDGPPLLIPFHRVLEVAELKDTLCLTVRSLHPSSAVEYVEEYVEDQINIYDCIRLREMMNLSPKKEYLCGT